MIVGCWKDWNLIQSIEVPYSLENFCMAERIRLHSKWERLCISNSTKIGSPCWSLWAKLIYSSHYETKSSCIHLYTRFDVTSNL